MMATPLPALRRLLSVCWGTLTAIPRACWALARDARSHRVARAQLRQQNPAAAEAADQLDRLPPGVLLVERFCLVDANGHKLDVEGMPGQVALYQTYGKALGRRRKGERVVRVAVPRHQITPTLRTKRTLPLAALLLLLAGCADVALLAPAPESAPALPVASSWTLCTTVRVDTLWVDGVPHEERLTICEAPPSPRPGRKEAW